MTETEYWIEVDKIFKSLVEGFEVRYEKSIDTEFIYERTLSAIRPLWAFSNFRIGYNGSEAIYDGGRLRYAYLDLQDGKRNFNNGHHLELDAYLKFEKYLEGDYKKLDSYHLSTSTRDELEQISDAEKLKKLLLSGNIDSFFKEIQAIFACLPYEINKSKEGYFHSHLHLLLRMIGAKITSEVSTIAVS